MTLLITTPWPLRFPGGGQRLARGIADALAAQSVDVVVAAGSGLTDLELRRRSGQPLPRGALAARGSDATHGLRRRSSADLYLDGLQSLAEQIQPGALLFTPHYSSCARRSRAIAEERGIPFVLWPAIHLDHDDHTSAQARRFYRSVDRILCLSGIERDWLVTRAGVPPERILMPGYPWHGPVLAPSPRVRHGTPVRLLSVGAFVGHKQYEEQLTTVWRLRRRNQLDVRLTIAGAAAEPAVIAELGRVRARLGLEANIDFALDGSDEDIAHLYANADAFVFTSRSESFGVAVLEAIARATPPIVYPHPVYGGLVEESGFGYVAAESTPDALAAAVLSAIDAKTCGSDAQRTAWLAEHSPARVGAALAAMLDRLATGRSVSRT